MATTPRDGQGTGLGPAPLLPLVAYTFLASLGTGAVTNGVFYLVEHAYGFTERDNFLLALASHAVYIPGALAVGPIIRRLRISPRRAAETLNAALAVACLVPEVSGRLLGVSPPPAASVLLVAMLYAPFTGALWPVVESFVGAGRSERNQRRAVGWFNLSWSAAMVAAFWAMGPLIESAPIAVLTGLGACHVLAAPLLTRLPPRPAAEPANAPTARRDTAERAHAAGRARVFRALLPASYVVLSALDPFLASSLAALDIAPGWRPPVVSAWLISRLVMFGVLHVWHGWHRAPRLGAISLVGLLVGFGVVTVAPALNAGSGFVVLLSGLTLVGAAQATIYKAALAYAMESADSHVEAGGWHEALIGVGYTLGPVCGLGVSLMLPGSEHLVARGLVLTALIATAATITAWLIGRTAGGTSRTPRDR